MELETSALETDVATVGASQVQEWVDEFTNKVFRGLPFEPSKPFIERPFRVIPPTERPSVVYVD